MQNTELVKPLPPPSRILREGSVRFCPKCGSSIKTTFWTGKELGCIQPECSNFYKHKTKV